jgi:hypothetical protein
MNIDTILSKLQVIEANNNPTLSHYQKDAGITPTDDTTADKSIGSTTKTVAPAGQQPATTTGSVGSVGAVKSTAPNTSTTAATTNPEDEEELAKLTTENVYVDVNVDPETRHSGARIETDKTEDTQMLLDLLKSAGIAVPTLPDSVDSNDIDVDVAIDPQSKVATTRVNAEGESEINSLLSLLKMAGIEDLSTAVNRISETIEKEERENATPNTPKEKYATIKMMLRHLAGGLNGEKEQNQYRNGDNPMADPVRKNDLKSLKESLQKQLNDFKSK